jgi:tetratricopeptide (TPR) repeat protein
MQNRKTNENWSLPIKRRSHLQKVLAVTIAALLLGVVLGGDGSAAADSPVLKSPDVNSGPSSSNPSSTNEGRNDDGQQPAAAADDERVNQLIEQLASPSYAARQSATEQLWQLGSAAKPGLERAAGQANPEVAKRAKEILSVLALGIDVNTSPEIAKLVLNFNFSEASVREDILEHLVREGKFHLVFDLLSQIKNVTDQGLMFHEVMELNDTLIRLARLDRWDEIEFILAHPITLEHERSAAVHFHLVNGTLPKILQQLTVELKARAANGGSVGADEWLRVIAIYRMQRRFAEAEILAEEITDADAKRQILHQIMLEKGDWVQVARRMVVPADNLRPDAEQIMVTPAQAALVHQLVGNQPGYDQTIAKLTRQASDLEQAEDREGAKRIRATLVEIGLANLDWGLVESNMDRTNVQQVFSLYMDHERVEEAFKVVGIEDDILQRNQWFDRKIETIKSLNAKIMQSDDKKDMDEVALELVQTWELCLAVADQLGSLGLTDEAGLHYLSLFSALVDDENSVKRIRLIGRLIYLEKYEEAWNLVDRGMEASEINQMSRYFFPTHKQDSASFWNSALAQRYPAPKERIKVVSGMLNSPLGTLPNFDFELELAIAESNTSLNETGFLDFHVASTLEYHGRFAASKLRLERARQLGNDAAKRVLARRALDQKDFAAAAEFYDSAWRYRTSAFDSCLAAEASRQMGEFKKAALRQCVAYAYWRDVYRNSATIESLLILNQAHLIADFLKLDVYCVNGGAISNERFRDVLAEALTERQPAESAIERQLILFNQCANPEPVSRYLTDWGASRKQINVVLAKEAIAQGQFDEAVELLLRCNNFMPGDPGIGETLIAELDRLGASQQADRLFENLAEFYVEILQRYPDSPLHQNNYAWLCACAKRRTSHMLQHAQKAVSQRPNTSSYLDTLATIHYQLGDQQKAIDLCRRCIELNPDKKHYRDQLELFESD